MAKNRRALSVCSDLIAVLEREKNMRFVSFDAYMATQREKLTQEVCYSWRPLSRVCRVTQSNLHQRAVFESHNRIPTLGF
jgi:hypothetical protein